MADWRSDIENAVTSFLAVAELASDSISSNEVVIEYMDAPHKPKSLPAGKMAVYGFWGDGSWLKFGIAGPNSGPRYLSQHYNKDSSRSNLAKLLANDPRMLNVAGFDANDRGRWIRNVTHGVNILISAQREYKLLSLLEAFLHLLLNPRYEG